MRAKIERPSATEPTRTTATRMAATTARMRPVLGCGFVEKPAVRATGPHIPRWRALRLARSPQHVMRGSCEPRKGRQHSSCSSSRRIGLGIMQSVARSRERERLGAFCRPHSSASHSGLGDWHPRGMLRFAELNGESMPPRVFLPTGVLEACPWGPYCGSSSVEGRKRENLYAARLPIAWRCSDGPT